MADDGSHSPSEGVPHLSDLRIVLLGNREAGKSSAGNTILGREEFDPEVTTLQCVKRQGEVAGRQVTVVDTPGWTGYDLSFGKDSPNLLKQELVLSVTLCPPGPHAFLLVVHENMTFTEAERNATTHHLSLLGHEAWKHSLVLFIQETPVEEKAFEVKGNMLQWLVEKFGSRCHVLNTKNRDDLQVRELLEKIDKMVAGNSGVGYETQRKVVKEYNMASEGTAQVWKRGPLRSLRQGNTFMSELALVLLGCEGAGKSSSGNTILGREEFDLKSRTAQCVKRRGTVAGRQVTVVEAPGWVPYVPSEYSSTKVKKEIVLSESLCARAPHTVCVVVRVDAAFKEQHKKSVRQHLGLLGDRVWSHAMVLFTRGDWLGDATIEQHIESEGESLRWLIEKCGNRYHVLNNHNCTDETQVTGLLEKIGEMAADNRGSVCERTCLSKKAKQVSEWKKHVEKRAEKRRKEQRRCPRPSVEKHPTLSEFRVVLLGHRGSGKSSSGNTILGREEFDLRRTAQCVKRQGEVAGRQVTVVEAPGWWYDVNLKDTPELTKQEIVLSPSMCAPGPHAFLLLLRVDLSVTERMRNMIQEYIDHLNGNVWNHAILLFTRGDWLGDTTIEQHMDNEGKTLKCLAEMCGNRYHVFSNMHRGDSTQVAQLMEKIEEMVAENRGRHYEMDRERLKEMEKRRKQQIERAKDREMFAYKRKTSLQLSLGDIPRLLDLRIVLLGLKVSGKSSAGNTILGREEFDPDVRTLQCVKRQGEVAGRQVTVVDTPGWTDYKRSAVCVKRQGEVAGRQLTVVDTPGWTDYDLRFGKDSQFKSGWRSAVCVKRQGEVAGRQVTVVDTPGWERSSNLRSSQLTEETDDLDKSIFSLKRHTAVLVVRVDLRFTEENRATVQTNLERLGEGVWSRTMVLFTHGDWLGDTPIEQHIVSEGGDLKWLIEKCGNRYHVLNNQNRTEDQVVQLLEKIEEMVGWHIEMNSKSPEEKERSPQMFEFSPGFLSKERERSWWEKTRTGEQRELDLASLNTPPVFGGDDRSDLTSLFSSGYGTKTPQTASECPSDWDPRMSAKTERSGIRSVRSGTLRKARTLPFSDSKGLKPSLKKRSRQKLARHKTVE